MVSFSRTDEWLGRLYRAAIILLVAAMVLLVLSVSGLVSARIAIVLFACLAVAALVPWGVRDPDREKAIGGVIDATESGAVAAVINGMPDPAILADRVGRVVCFNHAAAVLVPALRRGDLVQFALRTPEFIAALRRATTSIGQQRVAHTDRGQVERWMEIIISPVKVPTVFEGSEYLLLMTFHDMTPLRHAETMRADFVANVSHELRTPLAALSGFIDTLRGTARDDPKARERFLDIMHAQAGRMARLIDDLLCLSRIEQKAHLDPRTIVDLVPIVRQVVEGLEPLARERETTINVDLPTSTLAVRGDRDELLRMVENLLENAIKYGSSGKRVDIVATRVEPAEGPNEGPKEVRLGVRDYGPGIAPEHLPRLTERFYRVDVGESRSQGGTGLGLSLVKHILNRHRGRLLIESKVGAGATFTACLPLDQNASLQKINQ
jgi:two-component system phosphate regulon sensor histidine kinase PhoR